MSNNVLIENSSAISSRGAKRVVESMTKTAAVIDATSFSDVLACVMGSYGVPPTEADSSQFKSKRK